jgi:hypothetical protein
MRADHKQDQMRQLTQNVIQCAFAVGQDGQVRVEGVPPSNRGQDARDTRQVPLPMRLAQKKIRMVGR